MKAYQLESYRNIPGKKSRGLREMVKMREVCGKEKKNTLIGLFTTWKQREQKNKISRMMLAFLD